VRHSTLSTALALTITACGAGLALADSWQEQSTATLPAADVRRVRVENSRGLVTVTRGRAGEVRVEALKVVRSNDEKWARRVLEQTEVTAETRDGELVIRAVYPQRQTVRVRVWDLFNDFELPRIEIRLAIQIPPGVPLALKSTSGDLSTTGIGSSQTIETTSGDVVVSGAGSLAARTTSGDVQLASCGATKLVTVSGDVTAEGMTGPLRLETTSGDVRIRQATDSLSVLTVSGDIVVDRAPRGIRVASTSGGVDVRRASGRVMARTTSGDLGIGLAAPIDGAELATSNGDVQLHLAGAVPCVLDFETTNGDIQIEAALNIQNVTRHRVRAVVHDGRAPVMVRTASGDIRVTEEAR